MKKSIPEYTEAEFIEFLHELFEENGADTDIHFTVLIQHFINITEHPAGTDLIFYPENGKDNSADEITEIVKKWRMANGLPGFKKES